MVAAGLLTVATRGTAFALPGQDSVQSFSVKRFLAVNLVHQLGRIVEVSAHECMTFIVRRWCAVLLTDRIAVCARTQLYVVVKGQRLAHVCTCSSVVAKQCVDRTVLVNTQRKTLLCPSLQSFPVYRVVRVLIQ